jgi:hypothetical protein
MMYEFRLTVPANTTAANPLVLPVNLAPGRIVAMAVQFPALCSGFAHAQILESLYVHWPSNPDADICADAAIIAWQESYDLDPTAPRLRLVGWNLDDTWPHTITFRINVLPAADIAEQGRALKALGFLADWYEQRGAA